MGATSINALLRVKYEALGGVPSGLSFSELERRYFQVRSGASLESDTGTSFYQHTVFDNLSIAEGGLIDRWRAMFVLESAATADMSWEDAAQIWATT